MYTQNQSCVTDARIKIICKSKPYQILLCCDICTFTVLQPVDTFFLALQKLMYFSDCQFH